MEDTPKSTREHLKYALNNNDEFFTLNKRDLKICLKYMRNEKLDKNNK